MPYRFEERDGVIVAIEISEEQAAALREAEPWTRRLSPGRVGRAIFRRIWKPEYTPDGDALLDLKNLRVNGESVAPDGKLRYAEPRQQAILGFATLIPPMIFAIVVTAFAFDMEGRPDTLARKLFVGWFLATWFYSMGFGFAAIFKLMQIRYQTYELDDSDQR